MPDKLLLFKLDDSTGKGRTIVSGIRKWYGDGASLVGKTVIIVANLKPAKIRGIVSDGMILSAADDEDKRYPSLRFCPMLACRLG